MPPVTAVYLATGQKGLEMRIELLSVSPYHPTPTSMQSTTDISFGVCLQSINYMVHEEVAKATFSDILLREWVIGKRACDAVWR